MFGDHWYNESTRRMVSVFGSLFSNLEVKKTDSSGNELQTIKVPLAYGPRQKYTARLKNLNDSKMGIKLPRLSFEITDMTYDGAARVNKNKVYKKVDPDDPKNRKTLGAPAVYKVGFELNIMAKGQDEALQILEQILPVFQPDYTVTIKDIPDLDLTSDIPIVLTGITMYDEYEGDLITRRAVIYTLTFETRIRYYRGIRDKGIIEQTEVYYWNKETDTKLIKHTIDGTTTPYTEDIDYLND